MRAALRRPSRSPLTSPGGGAGHTTGGSPRPRPPHSTSPARRSEPVHHQDRLGMGRGPRTIATQGSRPVGRRVARNPDNTSDPPAAFREESPSPILMHSSRQRTKTRLSSHNFALGQDSHHPPDRLGAPRIAGRVSSPASSRCRARCPRWPEFDRDSNDIVRLWGPHPSSDSRAGVDRLVHLTVAVW